MAESISIDFTGAKSLSDLAREFPLAAIRALSRTGRSLEVRVNKEIRNTWNISRAEVDKRITSRITGINRISQRGVMEFRLKVKGGRLRWLVFNPRQTRAGVSIQIVKGHRKLARGAFIPEMNKNDIGVFMRKGAKRRMKRGRYAGRRTLRQPIVEMKTISVADMFRSRKISEEVDAFVAAKLIKEMDHQVSFFRRSSAGGDVNMTR